MLWVIMEAGFFPWVSVESDELAEGLDLGLHLCVLPLLQERLWEIKGKLALQGQERLCVCVCVCVCMCV